jgi:hypothetical protein
MRASARTSHIIACSSTKNQAAWWPAIGAYGSRDSVAPGRIASIPPTTSPTSRRPGPSTTSRGPSWPPSGEVESGLGANDGPSNAGALGPMQFLPSTWNLYGDGGDTMNPDDAIPRPPAPPQPSGPTAPTSPPARSSLWGSGIRFGRVTCFSVTAWVRQRRRTRG